jgi:flagellar FliL protein
MSDDAKPAKKKGGMKKMIVMVGGIAVVLGAGVGGGIYATQSGLIGGGAHAAIPAEDPNTPKLVKKGEKKEEAEAEGGHGGGHGESEAEAPVEGTKGGEAYESTYYTMDKEFTSNLKDSPHFVQVGISLATHYDDRVIANVKNNEIPVRSAILMALSDAGEEQVFSQEGKTQLAENIRRSINKILEQKSGFGGISNVYFTNFIVQ